MTAAGIAAFLAADFARIGDAVLARCAALDGQRLCLSGATGFFGRNLLALLAHLHGRGLRFEVSAISRDPQRFAAAEPWLAAQSWLQLVSGDVRQPWPVSGSHDLLLHAATDTDSGAHRDLQAVFDDMLAATRQALACAAALGAKRLLLTGSGAQYDSMHAAAPIDERTAMACNVGDPHSAYGEAKRVAELLAALHAQRHGTTVVFTRCFAFVGPGLPLDGHFVIGNLLRDALAGLPLRLQTRGLARRSYLYSADLALWLLLLLLHAPAGTQANVGSDHGLSVLDLAHVVRDTVAPALAVSTGADAADARRSFYVPAIARARALGLEVWTPLPLAVARTAQWHRLRAA